MPHQRLDPAAGWNWIAQGWRLFTQAPGIWVVIALILFVIYVVLNVIPLIGGIVGALLGPAFLGGMVYGARELDDGRSLEIAHLFQAFREPGRVGPMLTLGLVPLAAGIVMALVGAMVFSGAAGTGAATGSGGAAVGVLAGGGIMLALVGPLLGLIVGALLLCSVPRVMGGVVDPMQGIQESARAVLDNLAPYLVFALIYFLLSLVAALPMGLGFLILVPVIASAVHAANRQIFGEEQSGPLAEASAGPSA